MRKKPEVDIYLPREAKYDAADMAYYTETDLSFLCFDSLRHYRDLFKLYQPNHPWNGLSDEEFCIRLGFAIKEGKAFHLTKAGLLLFGYDYTIRRFFPYYALSYKNSRDMYALNAPQTRIESLSGTWGGGLFDFFISTTSSFAARQHLLRHEQGDQSLMVQVIRELLSLAICNIDFSSREPLVLGVGNDGVLITFGVSNDATVETLHSKAIANPTIANALACLNLAKRRGMGIDFINKALKTLGYEKMKILVNNGVAALSISTVKTEYFHQNPHEMNSFEQFLSLIRPGEVFSRTDVIKATGKSPAMASIYLQNALKEGMIAIAPSFKRGKYIKRQLCLPD